MRKVAAGYDLTAADAVVIPGKGNSLVRTALFMSILRGWYGRIEPHSGLSLPKFIDIGALVIDEKYGCEIGVP